MPQDFRLQVFFPESVSPKPLGIPYSTVCIRATGVVDTGGKFATAVFDYGGTPCLANISVIFRKKFEIILMLFSGEDNS